MSEFVFDPKIFISPPYVKCPNCKIKDSFGVLWIGNNYYSRRCKDCLFTKQYTLPKLEKLILYIDQFAISNMMKALNPKTKAYKREAIDDFWRDLFGKLDILSKLQLIICPDSEFQSNESLVSPFFPSLRRMYELFSQGVTFKDKETIRRFQVTKHARNWIRSECEKPISLDVNSIVHGDINAWQERFILTVNVPYSEETINEIRDLRSKTHDGLSRIFSQWQNDKDKSFDFWFHEESRAFGDATLKIYFMNLEKYKEMAKGRRMLTMNDIMPSSSVILIKAVQSIFKEEGVEDNDIWPKTIEYFNSPSLANIPFNKISSMLFASLARKAATGRQKPPNRGMVNDIDMISTLLPYCDAMFIDKECHGYLLEEPTKSRVDYRTKIFSLLNKEEFFDYLDSIKKDASCEHIDKIEEVYGTDWKKPFTEIFIK